MTMFNGTVLVAGATGKTGIWIVERLRRHGIRTRLFVRSSPKAIELFGPEIADSLATGSLENAEEIRAALYGTVAVICAVGGNVRDPAAPPPSVIDRDGIIRLATVASQMQIKKFVLVSSMAVTRPDHPLNRYGQVLTMKLESENVVRKLFSDPGYSYTILRPGGLLDGPPMMHALRFDTGDKIITGAIQRSDVAELAVLALFTPQAHNLTFELVQEHEAPQESLSHFFSQITA